MSFIVADVIFWIAVACCGIAQLAIIHSVIVSPARAAGSAPTSGLRRAGELAWAIIPAIALACVLVLTWRAMPGAEHHAIPVRGIVS